MVAAAAGSGRKEPLVAPAGGLAPVGAVAVQRPGRPGGQDVGVLLVGQRDAVQQGPRVAVGLAPEGGHWSAVSRDPLIGAPNPQTALVATADFRLTIASTLSGRSSPPVPYGRR